MSRVSHGDHSERNTQNQEEMTPKRAMEIRRDPHASTAAVKRAIIYLASIGLNHTTSLVPG